MDHDHQHLSEENANTLIDRLQENWETILNEYESLCFSQVVEVMLATCFTMWSEQICDHDDYLIANAKIYAIVAHGMAQLHAHVAEDEDESEDDGDSWQSAAENN